MQLIRQFELKAEEMYKMAGKIRGFFHAYIGQEAIAAGCLTATRPEDPFITAYRDHGLALAKGVNPNACMAELYGKATGCSKGKGGSMHIFSKEHNFIGGHGIVGGQVPLATGAGWKIKYKKEDNVVLCYLGDAAINQGQFHEALNMAAIWDLPCIFIIENNLYGMGTAISRTCKLTSLADRAKGYNMRQAVIDGHNVVNTYTQMSEIIEETRRTSKPILVEAMTYRFRGHSVSDPGNYRTKEEVELERQKDCLLILKNILLEKKALKEIDFENIEDEINDQVEEAVTFAEESEEPPLDELYHHVLV